MTVTAMEAGGPVSVVTMAWLRLHWKAFTFAEADGKCTARALSGKRELVTADTPGDLLRYLWGRYDAGTPAEKCST